MRLGWSERRALNLRPLGPEGEKDESHGVSQGGFGSQTLETIQEQRAPSLGPVAENASVETSFGAPVVRELPPDPGPHEQLITVRAVAARLGLCSASVYKLCQRGELRGLRPRGLGELRQRLRKWALGSRHQAVDGGHLVRPRLSR